MLLAQLGASSAAAAAAAASAPMGPGPAVPALSGLPECSRVSLASCAEAEGACPLEVWPAWQARGWADALQLFGLPCLQQLVCLS